MSYARQAGRQAFRQAYLYDNTYTIYGLSICGISSRLTAEAAATATAFIIIVVVNVACK